MGEGFGVASLAREAADGAGEALDDPSNIDLAKDTRERAGDGFGVDSFASDTWEGAGDEFSVTSCARAAVDNAGDAFGISSLTDLARDT